MDFRVVFTKSALADLQDVMRWSWHNHPESSERFAEALHSHIDVLREFPGLGAVLRKRSGIRKLVHWPLHVYYRVEPERRLIEVLRIRHGARRMPRL